MNSTGLNGELVLVRHGQTYCTLEGRFCGAHEGVLTEVGGQMASLVAGHHLMDGVRAIVTSPAERARKTAEALSLRHNVSVRTDDRLRELFFGEWEDRLPTEVDQELRRRWEFDPALFAPPGGETGLMVMARAVAAVRDALHDGGKIAVVTHKAPLRLVLSFFLGLRPSRYREIGNVTVGSLSYLRIEGERITLKAIGDVSHLPERWRAAPDVARLVMEGAQ